MVFTGTRADFGLLRPVIDQLSLQPALDVLVVAGGSHFSAEFGSTVDEITGAGYAVDWRVETDLSENNELGIARATADTLASVARAIDQLRPDIGLVLGDRYEALGFATACLLCRVPLAHVHGGETTAGAVDDAIRHAITQMATLHFVAAEPFAERVLRMGADPERIVISGAPGLDTVLEVMPEVEDPRALVESIVGPLPEVGPIFLVAFHPETRSASDPGDVMRTILEVLLGFDGSTLLVSAPNADWGRDSIADVVEALETAQPDRVRSVASFGHRAYIAAMMIADVVVGNSSSGVIEAPLIGTPTVNVGRRQEGRPLSRSIYSSSVERADIERAIFAALKFERDESDTDSVYGRGDASHRIVAGLLGYFDS